MKSSLLQWTRPAQLLVYLLPVGNISPDLLTSYIHLIQIYSTLPLRNLTRPGGYAAELSPFHGIEWTGPGALRFHFVSTAEHVESYNGEDVHASHRVIGVLGICHSPSMSHHGGLRAAYADFKTSVQHFPGLLMQKLFAFEHTFENDTTSECKGLDDLVMFPVHHKLQDTDDSTVSLHLQVVMETLAVTILMSLESAIRSATIASSGLPLLAVDSGHLANVLLDVNVKPQHTNDTHKSEVSPLVFTKDANVDTTFGSVLSPATRSLGLSFSSIPSPLTASVAALDTRTRRRKRQAARREKLLGDYNVLVSCMLNAINYYTVAIEMLREEERHSSGSPGDALWLAAALEGYVFCLYTESQDKFSAELIEKASEAVAYYAKAGTIELESLFIENIGSYYARVAMATLTCTSMTGEARLLESVWMKRLLWDVLERGMVLSPELPPQRQVEFLIQTSRILERVSHRRRAALFLHEAASLLLNRNTPCVNVQTRLVLSPVGTTKKPQRQRDLEAALILERVAAEVLGIQGQSTKKGASVLWRVTTQHERNWKQPSSGSNTSTIVPDNAWLIIRFHVLRQLLTIARTLGDALLVGMYCLQLLEMLVWCDSIAALPNNTPPHTYLSPPSLTKAPVLHAKLQVDHLQRPATYLRVAHLPDERAAAGLHAKHGIYLSPPRGMNTRIKRNFINSPSTTMSNAAASISSTLYNTPRVLATPRQQFSAAVNAISTKASPAFAPFSNAYHQRNGLMSGRAGSAEDRTAGNVGDGKQIDRSNENVDAGYKRSQSLSACDGKLDEAMRFDTAIGHTFVWDLRSKAEIVKMERQLLNMLESDCAVLRLNEQMWLPTFLKVDKLKLRSSYDMKDPFLSRVTALEMFGVQSTSSQQAMRSEFFYSPFNKQKTGKTGHRGSSQEEDDDDIPAMYERGFPATDRIELQLILSNPMGVFVKVQEVKAWVAFVTQDDEVADKDGSTNSASKEGDIECYPCSFTLEPYRKRKSVVLSIQPLRAGVVHVRGCFIKAFNITTTFELENPVKICVVGELPKVSLFFREHTTMTPSSDNSVTMSSNPVAAKTRLAVFLSETRRCTFCIRNTRNRQITNYRLAVTVHHRRAGATETRVISNNLPPASAAANDNRAEVTPSVTNNLNVIEPDHGKIDTPFLSLKYDKMVLPSLPFASGDCVNIPFEVSLRGNDGQVGDNIQIEWCFVYADEAPLRSNDVGDSREAIFYRESKLVLELALLPSLILQSVTLLSCCAEQIPTSGRSNGDSASFDAGDCADIVTTDYSYCIIMVHIVNPTETSFRFRLHHSTDSSCEEEIGRQCSRRFTVEIPRLQSFDLCQESSSLADVLNDLVEMEWKTHFNTRGRLLCENHHVALSVDHRQMKLELVLPPVRFQIKSPHKNLLHVNMPSGKQIGDMDVWNSKRGMHIALDPLRSFQLSHRRVKLQSLPTELFTYVPIDIAVQRVYNGDQMILGVEMEVRITEERHDVNCKTSEHVMIVGQLHTFVHWNDSLEKTTKHHEIQCLFLSEGNFRVTVSGRVFSSKMKQIGGEIWCHDPIYVCVRSDVTALMNKM